MKKAKPAESRSKAASRKKATRPSLSDMRGVACFDTNEIILLVNAGVQKVAKALKVHRKLKTWLKEAYGKTVIVDTPCYPEAFYLVYQLKGHPWTIIDSYLCHGSGYLLGRDAAVLSKALKTKVIYYGNSDTSCTTEYELYDRGRLREKFRCGGENLEFSSKVRDVEKPENGPEIYPFVDKFMREQEAFAPSWSQHFWFCLHCLKPEGAPHEERKKFNFGKDFAKAVTRLDFLGW